MKWVKRIMIWFTLLFIVTYFVFALWASFLVNSLVNSSYKNHGKYDEKLEKVISEDLYGFLDYSNGYYEHEEPYEESCKQSFPITYHFFFAATVTYKYSYLRTATNSGEILSGSSKVPVTVRLVFKDWHWKVVKISEAP